MIYKKNKNNLSLRILLSESIGLNLSCNCVYRNDVTDIYKKNNFTGEILNVSEFHVLIKTVEKDKSSNLYLIRIYDIFDYCIY